MTAHSATGYRLRSVKIEVSHRCLLRCKHCSSNAGQQATDEIPLDKCIEIINEAHLLGVREIAFSGGEPFLWPHLDIVIKTASRLGIKVSIYSSGNFSDTEFRLSSCTGSGTSTCVFSLYSARGSIHDSVTCVAGSHTNTVRAISAANDLGLNAQVHFVPVRSNFRELSEVVRLAEDLGCSQLSILRFVPQGRGRNYADARLTLSENAELRRSILALRASGHRVRTGSPYNFLMLRDGPTCLAGIDRMTIMPDLTIRPCDAFKQIDIGVIAPGHEHMSLANHSLAQCWQHSPYLAATRDYLNRLHTGICASCSAFEMCSSGCMAQKIIEYGIEAVVADPDCLVISGHLQEGEFHG